VRIDGERSKLSSRAQWQAHVLVGNPITGNHGVV
jgi:hypothetical protein